jgi:hypothetical protein
MWLIDTMTLKLEFVNNPEDHEYAILSHTWGSGEVSFQEMANLDIARTKPGFSKIKRTCKLARDQGLWFAWVDTCCIDKTSSAELTEAINSMFRYYQAAAVCFVYLSDLPTFLEPPSWSSNRRDDGSWRTQETDLDNHLPQCRWFTRGWTLQELIASKVVEFYDEGWQLRGDKQSLRKRLSSVTGIEEAVLHESTLIPTVPVATRMSWAAKRRTSRVEDLSYCLFGIFDIHLPLIYGEGMKAFLRLQEAIALENNDLSLFAWTSKPEEDPGLRGIFALHPSEFEFCSQIIRTPDSTNPSPVFSFTNKGFHITTRLGKCNGEYLMDLQCVRGRGAGVISFGGVFIRLLKTADGFVRHESNKLDNPADFELTKELSIYISRRITPVESQQLKLRLSHTFTASFEDSTGLFLECTFNGRPEHLWDSSTNSFITDSGIFKGVIEITIEGMADFLPGGLGPSSMLCKFWWQGSAVLGLEPDPETLGDHDNEAWLTPWAAIYDRKDKDINDIVLAEKREGILHTQEQIKRILSHEGGELAVYLDFKPEWSETNGGPNVPLRGKWIKENQFSLHVSTKAMGDGNKKHLLVLEIQRSNAGQFR